MRVFKDLTEWREYRQSLTQKLGVVMTMGNLHVGHVSLIERSVLENEQTLLTIYVNPTQFNNENDLVTYPKTLEADLAMAEAAGTDYVLLPTYQDIYPDKYRYQMTEKSFSKLMEGEHRPGHFDGMLTVVMKLLMLAKADNAYFGEKDYQQFCLVRDMAEAFFIDTNIVPCPIIRAEDGLALSSRNSRLNDNERSIAPHIYSLLTDSSLDNSKRTAALADLGFDVEYIEEAFERRFIAAHLGDVRLIDNIDIQE